jgi:aerobic-type carbon monoxide dehydrogenase small subunit (CoxS/CutS family)
MPDLVRLTVNERPITVVEGTTVAVAVLTAGQSAFRHSVSGEPRGPLCGMGICFECRVVIDGVAHVRTCQILCRDGMAVFTS